MFSLCILGDKSTITVLIVGSVATVTVTILTIVIVSRNASRYKREAEEYLQTVAQSQLYYSVYT